MFSIIIDLVVLDSVKRIYKVVKDYVVEKVINRYYIVKKT